MGENKSTYIYPEDIVSAYILFKNRGGRVNESNLGTHITPKEAEQTIPILTREQSIKLNRLSYRNTALGGMSPEIRSYFTFLNDMHYSLFRHESETQVTPEGIEYAQKVIGKLWHQSPSAVNCLEHALESASKNWNQRETT